MTPRQSSTAELGVVVVRDFDERERERERERDREGEVKPCSLQ